tara:strand:- start:242 stop:1342 length:1101 start_codon:yes stop_codon:yes gene_type:complete
MSKGGQARIAETGTPASRVLFINSGDATNIFNDNTSNFMFVFDEPIVVPNHHSILMSLIGAEIPYTFYNFVNGRNTRLDVFRSNYNVPASYDANNNMTGFTTINLPQGNYNAIELGNFLENAINTVFAIPNLCSIRYDINALKFKFACNVANNRITLATQYGIESGIGGNDMNEELGFDLNTPSGDGFFERDATLEYRTGFTDPPGVVPGVGVDTIISGPNVAITYLYADDAADMNNSIRNLFIRSNLTTSSILDSFIGGGFSNIMARIPINAEPGGIINVRASDGNVHQLLIKVKEITAIHIRLTNQRNQAIDLNGLNFDVAIKMDFIENQRLAEPENIRQLVELAQEEEKDLTDIEKKQKTNKK